MGCGSDVLCCCRAPPSLLTRAVSCWKGDLSKRRSGFLFPAPSRVDRSDATGNGSCKQSWRRPAAAVTHQTHTSLEVLLISVKIYFDCVKYTLSPNDRGYIFEALGTYRSVYGQNEKNTHLGCILVIFETSMALPNATVSAILVRNSPLTSVKL